MRMLRDVLFRPEMGRPARLGRARGADRARVHARRPCSRSAPSSTARSRPRRRAGSRSPRPNGRAADARGLRPLPVRRGARPLLAGGGGLAAQDGGGHSRVKRLSASSRSSIASPASASASTGAPSLQAGPSTRHLDALAGLERDDRRERQRARRRTATRSDARVGGRAARVAHERDVAAAAGPSAVRCTASELTTRFGRGSGWRHARELRRAVASVRPLGVEPAEAQLHAVGGRREQALDALGVDVARRPGGRADPGPEAGRGDRAPARRVGRARLQREAHLHPRGARGRCASGPRTRPRARSRRRRARSRRARPWRPSAARRRPPPGRRGRARAARGRRREAASRRRTRERPPSCGGRADVRQVIW